MFEPSVPPWLSLLSATRTSLQESLTCVSVCRAWRDHILEMLKACILRKLQAQDEAIWDFLPDLAVLRRLSSPNDTCITAAFETCIKQVASRLKDGLHSSNKRRKIVDMLCRFAEKDNPAVTFALCACLDDDDRKLRQSAAEALGCLVEKNAQHAVAALCACLEDNAPDVRASSIKTLGRLAENDQGAMLAIRMRLKHRVPFVRCSAILALVQIANKDDEDVLNALRSCLNDVNVFVKREAASGLAQLAGKNGKHAFCVPAA